MSASDNKLEKSINAYLESLFQKDGFVIDNTKFDGELSGKVIVTNKQEYQLEPYADSSETLVQRDIELHNLNMQLKHENILVLNQFVWTVETLKSMDKCENECLNIFFEQLRKRINLKSIKQSLKK